MLPLGNLSPVILLLESAPSKSAADPLSSTMRWQPSANTWHDIHKVRGASTVLLPLQLFSPFSAIVRSSTERPSQSNCTRSETGNRLPSPMGMPDHESGNHALPPAALAAMEAVSESRSSQFAIHGRAPTFAVTSPVLDALQISEPSWALPRLMHMQLLPIFRVRGLPPHRPRDIRCHQKIQCSGFSETEAHRATHPLPQGKPMGLIRQAVLILGH